MNKEEEKYMTKEEGNSNDNLVEFLHVTYEQTNSEYYDSNDNSEFYDSNDNSDDDNNITYPETLKKYSISDTLAHFINVKEDELLSRAEVTKLVLQALDRNGFDIERR